MNWLRTILVGVVTTLIAAWLLGFFNRVVPPPARAWLALKNLRWVAPQRPEDSFRIVLCWLENDSSGDDTRTVEQAFGSIEGITLVRSSRIVAASGAADEWRPAMQQSARAVIEDWIADLAVAGRVKKSGEVLSLWIVPQSGGGTLNRGDQPYNLVDVTLGADFHEDVRAQLAAVALAAVAPFADTEARGRILEQGLWDATDKLANLLDGTTIIKPQHRAALQSALGDALVRLGERESSPDRFEQAVNVYLSALEVFTRERAPLQWARMQNNLGNALLNLGNWETGTERFEEAAGAYRSALELTPREKVSLEWAATQANLGNALSAVGRREPGGKRLEQAVDAYHAALQVSTRERSALQWATTQNNLGNALVSLAQREGSTDRLQQAVDAVRAALTVFTREHLPLDWATAQTNLGNALLILGTWETGTKRILEAENAYRVALQERTRERVPLDWALTQNNLGKALFLLGEQKKSANLLELAVNAYRAALEVLDTEGPVQYLQLVRNNLGEVMYRLRESQP